MRRAALYCRISDDRTGAGLGVKRQEDDCRALCDQKQWAVVEVIADNDLGAYAGKRRPGFERLLDGVKNGEWDTIVVWHLDRLTRRPVELERVIELIELTGALVVTVTGGDYDLTTTDGRAMARVVGAFARKESEDKARRTKRKHLELAQAGAPVGGGRPFGYEQDRVRVREDEAELVREAARRVLAGETLRSICQDWRQRGILSPKGVPLDQTALRRILTSHRIAGVRSLAGVAVAPALWPAIVDDATHRRLWAILSDPARTVNGGWVRSYLLTGFLHCHRCDTKLIARANGRPNTADAGRRRTYVCSSDPSRRGCGGLRVQAEAVEQEVVERLFAVIDHPVVEQLAAREGERHADDELLAEIVADEAALEQLARDHYVDRKIGRGEFLAARQGLEVRVEAARRRLVRHAQAEAKAAWMGDGPRLVAEWEAMDLSQKRVILGAFIERIVIGPGRRGANTFDPTRVNVHWRV